MSFSTGEQLGCLLFGKSLCLYPLLLFFILEFAEFQVYAEAFDPFEVYFCAGWKLGIQFHSFTYGYHFSKYHLLKMLSFLRCVFLFLAYLSKYKWLLLHEFNYILYIVPLIYMSVLVPVPCCLYLIQLCSVTWSQYGDACSIIHFSQDCCIYSCVFNKNFKFYAVKNDMGDMEILLRISLNPEFALGRMVISIVFIIPINKYWRYFYLLMFYLIALIRVLYFSS